MTNQNKWIVGGIVVVAVAIIIYAVYSGNKSGSPTGSTQTVKDASAQGTSTDSSTTGGKLSYGDAIKKYGDRFQFTTCNGKPGIISVRQNSPVMLDNRDKIAHTIKADGQSFRIAALDYAIIYPAIVTKDNVDLTLSNVTCDGGGAATLNVEK